MAAVPPTMKVADDVVICLDLDSGKTLWKSKSPGEATGRMASSTPCVAGGRVYALGARISTPSTPPAAIGSGPCRCRSKAPPRRRWSWTTPC